MPTFRKDPSALLDYKVDWSAWLAGDTISAHTVTVPTGITESSDSHTDTTVTFWLAGGTVRGVYDVTVHITTAAGRQDERTVQVRVEDR